MIPTPFEGKEDAQRDDFRRPQVRQGMFGHTLHGFIYPIEQLTDKILGYVVASSHCKVLQPAAWNHRMTLFKIHLN